MRAPSAFRRIYRMDDAAEVDWSLICANVKSLGQGPPPPLPPVYISQDTDSLRPDYLSSVLTPLQWYSIDLKKVGLDEHGCPVEKKELLSSAPGDYQSGKA